MHCLINITCVAYCNYNILLIYLDFHTILVQNSNFLMSIIFALLQLFDFIELIVPIVVLKI